MNPVYTVYSGNVLDAGLVICYGKVAVLLPSTLLSADRTLSLCSCDSPTTDEKNVMSLGLLETFCPVLLPRQWGMTAISV